jgi:hypothetical protein
MEGQGRQPYASAVCVIAERRPKISKEDALPTGLAHGGACTSLFQGRCRLTHGRDTTEKSLDEVVQMLGIRLRCVDAAKRMKVRGASKSMVKRIDAREAIAISAANMRSRSRGRGHDNYLEPECWPALNPKFNFAPGASIFTIGSCFARNIERQMANLGFSIPTMKVDIKYSSNNSKKNEEKMPISAIFNKYTPPSIYQELMWTYEIMKNGGLLSNSDCEKLFYYTKDNKVIDLHLFPVMPVEYDFAINRRHAVYEVFPTGFFLRCYDHNAGSRRSLVGLHKRFVFIALAG